MRTSLLSIGKTSGQLLSLTSDMIVLTIPESLSSGTLKLKYIQTKQIDFNTVNVRYNHIRCRSYNELSFLASPWTFKAILQKAEQMRFPLKQFVHARRKPESQESEPDCVTPVTPGNHDLVQATVDNLRKTWDLIEKHSHFLSSYKGGMARYILPRPGLGYLHEKKQEKDSKHMRSHSTMECQKPIFKSRAEEDAWNEKQDFLTLEAISKKKKETERLVAIEESQKRKSIKKRMAHFVLSDCKSTPNIHNEMLSSQRKSTISDRDGHLRLSACRISITQVENKSGIEKSRNALENMTIKQFSQFMRKVKPFAEELQIAEMLIKAGQGHKTVKKTFCNNYITDQLVLKYFSEYNWCI